MKAGAVVLRLRTSVGQQLLEAIAQAILSRINRLIPGRLKLCARGVAESLAEVEAGVRRIDVAGEFQRNRVADQPVERFATRDADTVCQRRDEVVIDVPSGHIELAATRDFHERGRGLKVVRSGDSIRDDGATAQ